MLLHVTTDTADNLQPTTNQYGSEGEEYTSALRTRLVELQAIVEEVENAFIYMHQHLQTPINSLNVVCQKERNECRSNNSYLSGMCFLGRGAGTKS